MIFRLAALGLLFLFSSVIPAQPREGLRIAFYNLENLFDVENDTTINDEEFTPGGMRNWNDYRYREKVNRMAKAILSIGKWQAPGIVGVAEIENRKVLEDLVASPALAKFGYDIVHYSSPDRRGIDVGMIYRKEKFTVLHSRNIPVKMPGNAHFTTRDILYIKGLFKQDTLHLMYCHWPSRYGGQQQSEPKRIRAAQIVRRAVDSIQAKDPESYIIIAGDLNDEWTNASLSEHLKAKPFSESYTDSMQLINLMASLDPDRGSHRYRGTWSYLDQIIVSSNLLDHLKLEVKDQTAVVAEESFLLEKDEKYPGVKPFRTFIGMRYHGGFSDHLPVFVDLIYGSGEQ